MTETMSRSKRPATFHKIHEHNFHGTSVEIYRDGFYFWKNICFKISGMEIYKFEKSSTAKKGDCVNEYFGHELKKTYSDHHNSFIDFSVYLSQSVNFPQPIDFLTAGQIMGLEMSVVNMYGDYYNKFFGPK